MKIKEGYTLRLIVDSWIVIPTGLSALNFNDMLKLNESAALIWKALEKDTNKESIVSMLMSEYDIDKETAIVDVDDILSIFKEKGLLLNDFIVK